MTKEFRQIEKAPLYEMDKDGNIQKRDKATPVIAYPLGSRTVYLSMENNTRKSFTIDDLIEETFGEKKESEKEEESEEVLPNNGITTDETEEVSIDGNVESEDSILVTEDDKFRDQEKKEKKEKKKVVKEPKEKKVKIKKEPKEKKVKQERKVSSTDPIIEKIMALDCFESIKMWKLHQAGISNADITILVNDPHDFVVVKTLEKYTKNETLRNRADKVIV